MNIFISGIKLAPCLIKSRCNWLIFTPNARLLEPFKTSKIVAPAMLHRPMSHCTSAEEALHFGRCAMAHPPKFWWRIKFFEQNIVNSLIYSYFCTIIRLKWSRQTYLYMINRELIRIKTVQLVYANITNGGKSMEDAIDEMDESLSTASELYYHMLNLICDITDYAAQRYEMICTHLLERGVKSLPSDRFVANRFATQLQNNKQLEQFTQSHKQLRWTNHEDVVHSVYDLIIASPEYKNYMESDDDSYEADRTLWKVIYKKYIYQNDTIDEALEDWSIYWNDDRFIVDTFVLKTIKRFDEKNGDEQPLLDSSNNLEERKFGRDLLVYTLSHRGEYKELIRAHIRNWDFSRLATMDVAIMTTAIAEIINFPGITVNISLNEYINIARIYCSQKNANFINATLDNIVKDLRQEGKILK